MSQVILYHAVFYDTAFSKAAHHALNKRIEKSIYHNLIDGMGPKEVELKTDDGKVSQYKIKNISTFQITNSVESTVFIVCDCEKIKT